MATPTDQAIRDKFASLLNQGHEFLKTSKTVAGAFGPLEYQRWTTQAKNLIERVCGPNSAHYEAIQQVAKYPGHLYDRSHLSQGIGALEAAQDDYKDGFLAEIRYLVRADLLDDFLSQAEALLQSNYHLPAASLAGAVLEDTLRKLCEKHNIIPGKSIEAMNMELGRATVYDKLVQKEITAKGHLRNDADHGNFTQVKPPDVEDMLRWVRRFAEEHLK